MADKYARWNAWAPRYIADMVHDFGLTPELASAFPGNFAVESGYFNSLQEIRPLVPGSRGGLGHGQHTGPRRLRLEAWLKKKGWPVDSYEGNYSYIFRELKGLEPGLDYRKVIDQVKSASSLENAVWRVAKYYESPAVINLQPRIKAAREALALYKKNPPAPTHWPTDVKETTPMPVTPAPVVPVPVPVAPDTSRPAVPWYKSLVFTGATGGLGASLFAIFQAYQPGVPVLNQLDTLAPPVIAAFGTAMAVLGRVTSTAQPLTTSQEAADKIGVAKAAATATVAAGNVQHGVDSARPVHEAWNPSAVPENPIAMQPVQVPIEQLPLVQIANELPQVVDLVGKVLGTIGALAGPLGAIGAVGGVINEVTKKREPGTFP